MARRTLLERMRARFVVLLGGVVVGIGKLLQAQAFKINRIGRTMLLGFQVVRRFFA